MDRTGALIFFLGRGGRRERKSDKQEYKFAVHEENDNRNADLRRPAGSSVKIRGKAGFCPGHGFVLNPHIIAEAA